MRKGRGGRGCVFHFLLIVPKKIIDMSIFVLLLTHYSYYDRRCSPQLHLLRGKGAFQEENISLSNMRYARQARDFIYSDVGRRPMREGYQLEETYIENVSGGGWTHQIVGLVADGFHSCVFTDYYFERFNKAEKDFPTLLEYNNYLEEVEDISKSNTFPL